MTEETPFQTPPTAVPIPPAPTYVPPKPKFSLLPLLFGLLVVVILAAVFGVIYYKNKLTLTPSPSPTSSAIAIASADPEPSEDASPVATPSPKSSAKPSPKPTIKPVATTKPTPTPVPEPTLDIRFGNPSVNIKQTIDEGNGDGRVINREYTSIQTGQFDEVSTSWSPRITTCFHIVSNEEIKGSDLTFTFTLDDKVEVEDNLGQYDKLEAGRLYDWCHDTTTSIGNHTAKLSLNQSKTLKELNFTNNLARVDWVNLADKIAPNFTLGGPYNWDARGTCFTIISPTDNATSTTSLKIEQKSDSAAYASTNLGEYCFMGTTGDSHTYAVKVTDGRGNANEQSKTFTLY